VNSERPRTSASGSVALNSGTTTSAKAGKVFPELRREERLDQKPASSSSIIRPT
jgi:hypothetical protein